MGAGANSREVVRAAKLIARLIEGVCDCLRRTIRSEQGESERSHGQASRVGTKPVIALVYW